MIEELIILTKIRLDAPSKTTGNYKNLHKTYQNVFNFRHDAKVYTISKYKQVKNHDDYQLKGIVNY